MKKTISSRIASKSNNPSSRSKTLLHVRKLFLFFLVIALSIGTCPLDTAAYSQSGYSSGTGWEYRNSGNAHFGNQTIYYYFENGTANQIYYVEQGFSLLSPYVSASRVYFPYNQTYNFTIRFVELESNVYGDTFPYTGGGDHVGTVTLRFNSNKFENGSSQDLAEIAAHEICHGLGLDHVVYEDPVSHMYSLMHPTYSTSLTDLLPTDINGIRAVTDTCTSSGHGSFLYESNGSVNHTKTCVVCGAYTDENHTIGTTYYPHNTLYHRQNCTECSYYKTYSHTYGSYQLLNAVQHERVCTKCGYHRTYNHVKTYLQENEAVHTWNCYMCGYESFIFEEHIMGDNNVCVMCGYAPWLK